MFGAKRGERRPVRFDEPGQRVGTFSARQRIGVIERMDQANCPKEPCEAPHSWMRRRSASARREQEGETGHERQFIG
jgi:hypothetical protein